MLFVLQVCIQSIGQIKCLPHDGTIHTAVDETFQSELTIVNLLVEPEKQKS